MLITDCIPNNQLGYHLIRFFCTLIIIIGIVDDPSKSLFSYGPSEDFYSYYDPTFSPVFNPVFSNSSLEEEANVLCQGDISCLFDIAVTGRVEIGISTLEQVEIIVNVTETSKPSKIIYVFVIYQTF